MARKKETFEAGQAEAKGPTSYKIVNLKEAMVPVPYYDANGQVVHLHLRIQGKGGQEPPVLADHTLTPAARELVRKKIIRLERV